MKKLDKDQKQAVELDGNLVVTAGAGAGKTTVLAERYFRLVKEGKAGVESILTLTFTRKAAAEMHERIYRRLLDSGDPAALREAANFDRAHVSTLDSFSSAVARNASERFGVSGDFTVDNNAVSEIAAESVMEFLLEKHRNSSLRNFIQMHDFRLVYEELFIPLAVNHFNIASPVDFDALIRLQKEELLKRFAENACVFGELKSSVLSLSPEIGKTMRDNIKILDEFPDLTSFQGTEPSLQKILSAANIKKQGRSGHPDKELLGEYVDKWRELINETVSITGGLSGLPEIEGMFRLLGEFQEIFLNRKRAAGILSFSDVGQMAVRTLIEDTDLRNYYKNEFRYIMIDEFQDNNMMQKNLLFLLSERENVTREGIPSSDDLVPDKLFFVGDEKQSIYRFRGADVSVFKNLSGELGSSGGRSISLKTNYRSEPGLIDFFNSLFPGVMSGTGKDFEAEFSPLESREAVSGVVPELSVFYKPETEKNPGDLTSDEAEAWFIANYIRSRVERKDLMINRKGTAVPAEYGDFAILMRSTGNQILYEKYFRKLNIPCTVQDVRALFMEAPVNDIYNVLQLIVYPEDRTSYAALLRSPLVNLSDEAVISLLLEEGGIFQPESLAALDCPVSSDGDEIKYRHIRGLYNGLSDRSPRMSISEMITAVWYEWGYRNFLLSDPDYHSYLDYYEYLSGLAMAADERGESPAVFLDFMRANLGKYEKLPDLELLREEASGVQLMTVHKSKGLEFPVVILANAGNKGRGSDSSIFYADEEFGITLKYESSGGQRENYFFTRAKKTEEERELAENKRILYVAATRAGSHLIISGGHNQGNRNPESATGKKVLLNMVLSALGWNGNTDELAEGALGGIIKTIPDYAEEEVRKQGLFTFSKDPSEAASVYNSANVIERKPVRDSYTVTELGRLCREQLPPSAGGEELPALDSDSFLDIEYSALLGTYCHSIIESGLKGNSSDFPELPVEFNSFPAGQKITIKKDAENMASGFISSDFFMGMKNLKRAAEIPFLMRLDSESRILKITGKIDLVLESDDSIVIIDFKTDRIKAPEEHSIQMALYRKAAEEIFGKPVTTFLFYLREGHAAESLRDLDSSAVSLIFRAVS